MTKIIRVLHIGFRSSRNRRRGKSRRRSGSTLNPFPMERFELDGYISNVKPKWNLTFQCSNSHFYHEANVCSYQRGTPLNLWIRRGDDASSSGSLFRLYTYEFTDHVIFSWCRCIFKSALIRDSGTFIISWLHSRCHGDCTILSI